MILDSVASNACAHYLHNMLFILGENMSSSTEVTSFDAECYRANSIENFDTCTIKMNTKSGAVLYFAASHATDKKRDPEFVYEFEKATVTYSQSDGSCICAHFRDGTEKVYGDPFEDNFKKLSDCICATELGTTPVCTVKTATPHARLIEEMYKSVRIDDFPKNDVVVLEEKNSVCVPGLFERMYKAYENSAMLSDIEN